MFLNVHIHVVFHASQWRLWCDEVDKFFDLFLKTLNCNIKECPSIFLDISYYDL